MSTQEYGRSTQLRLVFPPSLCSCSTTCCVLYNRTCRSQSIICWPPSLKSCICPGTLDSLIELVWPGALQEGSIAGVLPEILYYYHNCNACTCAFREIRNFICLCSPFYFLDINECDEGGNDCHENANCTNILGSFNCTCKAGYTGDGLKCSGTDNLVHMYHNIAEHSDPPEGMLRRDVTKTKSQHVQEHGRKCIMICVALTYSLKEYRHTWG